MAAGSRDSGESENADSEEGAPSEKFGAPEYLGYRVIRERERQDGQPTSRSKFWKLCCITDRRLQKDSGLDIEFPRHWYKYGEVADVHSLDRDFIDAPSARHWSGQEILSDREIPISEFEVDHRERRLIEQAASKVVYELGKCSSEELKNYQYENHTDDEFVESYTRLRAQFEAVNMDQQRLLQDFAGGGSDPVLDLLNEMLINYPEGEGYYADVFSLFLDWDDTMRLMYEQSHSASRMKNFLEFFVEKLSEVTLRFEYHTGIPEGRIERWKENREDRLAELESGIEETRQELLEDYQEPNTLDTVADSFSDVIAEEIDELKLPEE